MPPLYHVRRQKSTSFAGAIKIRGNAEIGGEIACFFCAGLYNSATEKSAVFFRRGTAAWAAKAIMKDLTKGNPYKLILLFALPVFIGCVFQQLYNMADTIIVGNTVGADAFTGVGLTGPVTFLILGFVNGLTAGFSVKVAQAFGAGDEEGVRRATGMSYLLCILTAVVVTAVAVPLTGPLLTVMQTPAQYYDYAYSYLLIIFCGFLLSRLYRNRETYTASGIATRYRLLCLKKTFEDIRRMNLEPVKDKILHEQLVPYSIVFGSSRNTIKALKTNFPAKRLQIVFESYYFPVFIFSDGDYAASLSEGLMNAIAPKKIDKLNTNDDLSIKFKKNLLEKLKRK